MRYAEKSEKTIPRICSVCGKVIERNPEYIRTRRGTKLYFHRSCMGKQEENR